MCNDYPDQQHSNPKTKIFNMKRFLSFLAGCAAAATLQAQNPFLPLWEYIPDGEPYVFEDPDKPGEMRVYVYGSHDSLIDAYCGLEQVVWSAPLSDLTQWRYDGVIFENRKDRDGNLLAADGKGDLLYAPDVTVSTEADGTKTYYLFPNVQNEGRQGLVARSKRPDGPFEVINWNKDNPRTTDGVLRFDPAVFIDDDGRVYGYWGFEQSFCAELDPVTMATVKPGTEIVTDMISNYKQPGVFRFFEASSIRKIEDKYVFLYSRFTAEGEFGLPQSNYTLAYCYSDHPMGPWTYGGTVIDGRARKQDPVTGRTIVTATADGNTHGSIFEANGQWWVVYHRQTGLDEYSRQAMVAPISVKVEKGKGGKVTISEGEYTSEGFSIGGLNPLHRTPAGLACYYTGPEPATHQWPRHGFSGSYPQPTRGRVWHGGMGQCPVVQNTAGSVVGYKYFNMDILAKALKGGREAVMQVRLKPLGVAGTLRILLGAPSEAEGGREIGRYLFQASATQQDTELHVPLAPGKLRGKQALYFLFDSDTKGQSLCTLYDFMVQVK